MKLDLGYRAPVLLTRSRHGGRHLLRYRLHDSLLDTLQYSFRTRLRHMITVRGWRDFTVTVPVSLYRHNAGLA